MKVWPRLPTHRRPPPRRSTIGETAFAFGVAAAGLALAGALLVGAGDMVVRAWLPGPSASGNAGTPGAAPSTPGAAPTPAPRATSATSETPSLTGSPAASSSLATSPTPGATPKPTPTPAADAPFAMNLYRKGVFVHQVDKESCEAAAIQNMLNVLRLVEDGTPPDTSAKTQRAIYARVTKLTSYADSHNGGTGPLGWARYLSEKGYPYQLRQFATRDEAVRAAASALRATGRPVGILAWQGVHSWVLTGFRATRDPALTDRFAVTTAYIIDPWYPWVSTRWPRSEPPNAPRDAADLKANLFGYKLGSGPYPGRDGKYLIIAPLAH